MSVSQRCGRSWQTRSTERTIRTRRPSGSRSCRRTSGLIYPEPLPAPVIPPGTCVCLHSPVIITRLRLAYLFLNTAENVIIRTSVHKTQKIKLTLSSFNNREMSYNNQLTCDNPANYAFSRQRVSSSSSPVLLRYYCVVHRPLFFIRSVSI